MIVLLLEYQKKEYDDKLKEWLNEVNFFENISTKQVKVQYLFDSKESSNIKTIPEMEKQLKNKIKDANVDVYILFGKTVYENSYKLLTNKVIKNVSFTTEFEKCAFSFDEIQYLPTLAPGWIIRTLENGEDDAKNRFLDHLLKIKSICEIFSVMNISGQDVDTQ